MDTTLLPAVTFKMGKQVSFILRGEKTFLWESGRGEMLPATLRVLAHIQGFGDLKKGYMHVFCNTFPVLPNFSQSDHYNWEGKKYKGFPQQVVWVMCEFFSVNLTVFLG